MTEWDRRVFKETGILAVLLFIALVVVYYFGEDIEGFWKFVGWLVVILGVTHIGLWLMK